MAEIVTPRIESTHESHSEPQNQSAPKQQGKASATGKPTPPRVPQIGAPEEEDQHKLDEMA